MRIAGRWARSLAALLLLSTCLAPPAGARAPWRVDPARHDRAPLTVGDGFLLGAQLLRLEPDGVDTLPAGRWALGAGLTAANTFARSEAVELALEERDGRAPLTLEELRAIPAVDGEWTRFLLDGELRRLTLQARRGLRSGWEVEAALPVLTLDGGMLDGPIEDFHEAARFADQGRQGLPRDAFLLYLRGPRGEIFVDEEPGTRLGEPILAARRRLPDRWRRLDLAWGARAKLPTASGSSLAGSGSLDLGLELGARACAGAWCGHATAGLLHLGDWPLLDLPEREVVAGALGGQLLLPAGHSLLAQGVCATRPLGPLEIAELSGDACELSGGWRWSGAARSWTLAFTENLFVSDRGSDLALHLLWQERR